MSFRALTHKVATAPALRLSGSRTAYRVGARFQSTTPESQDPKAKADSILESLPTTQSMTKTGLFATGAAAAFYMIANDIYVVNAETVLLTTFSGVCLLAAKLVAPGYKQWADNRIKHVADILNSSRKIHVDSVKERIANVSELKNVTATTKVLFDVSKETLELEAKAFELKQQVDLATEAKAVLDSWVRYEASVRQMEQRQLAEAVISKVQSELTNPKFQDKVLQQSVSDVEKLLASLK